NTALKELLCEMTPLTRINLSNCPELEFIRLKDNMLTAIDLSNNPLLPLDGVYADGKGTVGYYYEEMEEGPWTCVFENPVDGETFLGWYNLEDELLSEDEYFNIADIADTVLIAKFTGAFQILPGDVDGDGEVTVADALLALRSSMGLIELDNAQWAAANVDGDEEVTVADALLILRASMGLLEL
ncbi:MAG: hypothetical protein IIT70_03345, partial [Clostridia bacterium]|nr:hypothetical protein [Clostridia bacterium]